MNAAIKCLEDNLIIRRLQAREFEGGHGSSERLAALRNDIASLERGLSTLSGEREASSGQQEKKNEEPRTNNEEPRQGASCLTCPR